MAIRKELTVRLQNSPGALKRLCQILAEERINIIALNVEAGGTLRMVVDNPLRAIGALETCDYSVEQRNVLFLEMPHRYGSFEHAAQILADADVNIEYTYASSTENSLAVNVVFGVENAERAATVTGV